MIDDDTLADIIFVQWQCVFCPFQCSMTPRGCCRNLETTHANTLLRLSFHTWRTLFHTNIYSLEYTENWLRCEDGWRHICLPCHNERNTRRRHRRNSPMSMSILTWVCPNNITLLMLNRSGPHFKRKRWPKQTPCQKRKDCSPLMTYYTGQMR